MGHPIKETPEYQSFAIDLKAKVEAGLMPIGDQTNKNPKFWIEVTQGMSGYFAVLLWDGCGFPEPWETGEGRYKTREEACVEALSWAEIEGIEAKYL